MNTMITEYELRLGTARSHRPLLSWLALWKERRDLARLDAHLLKDIGVSRDAAEIEANRAIWDMPECRKSQ